MQRHTIPQIISLAGNWLALIPPQLKMWSKYKLRIPWGHRTDKRGGVSARYNNLTEALLLLREMARAAINYHEAEALGIHRRNFYRYLTAFRKAGISVEKSSIDHRQHYWISRESWNNLIEKEEN